jgi:hypothetical protein
MKLGLSDADAISLAPMGYRRHEKHPIVYANVAIANDDAKRQNGDTGTATIIAE